VTDRNSQRTDWHSDPRGEAHTTLAGAFRTVREECAWRVDADEYHLGLYCASDKPGVKGNSRRGYEYGPATLPYNLCRSAVDTLQTKIAKHRPLPQVLTQRGNWKNQKRAKKMAQFLEGEFYRQRIYEQHAKSIIRDALIFGRGALKVWSEGRRIKVERAHPWELFADEWDARYGSPRNLYHCRSVDKGVLKETYARTESGGWKKSILESIETAGRFDLDDHWASNGGCTVDRIDIIEAWHLCDRPEEHAQAEDLEEPSDEEPDPKTGEPRAQGDQPAKHKCTGRHVVATTSGTLIDEPWEYDYFPYVVLNYNEAVVGVWGHGLVEQLEGYQYEINQSSERLSEMFHLSGVMVAVPDTAKITDQSIRNGIHILRHAAGGKPEVHQMDLVNEHVRIRPRELTEDGLNDAGLSQMSVQSQKPTGIDSGIGLQTLDDIETERFMVFGRAYETWNVELGRRFIDCAKQIAAAYGDHAVSVPMKGGLLSLRWNDVYVDGVELRAFPTSLLPTQPAARLERLVMLWERQVPGFDSEAVLRHMDNPDIQGAIDEQLSAKFVVDEMIEKMLEAEEEEGEAAAYVAPTAYQPWQWAAERAQAKLNKATLDGVPEFNAELLRQYIRHCEKMIDDDMAKKAAQAAAMNPAPPMGGPVNDMGADPGAGMMPGGGVAPVPPATPMAA
jgi:hypothetical protein